MNYTKFIASLLALCIAGSAYSFKVSGFGVTGKPIHEQITEDALKGINVVLSDGRIAYFSEETILGIQEENTENDEKGIIYGYMHFDDSRINESSSYVWNATNAAINGFLNSANGLGIKTNNGLSVITNLGTAAHTTQDFFAHSTWVETNIELKAYVDNGLKSGGFVKTNHYKYVPVPLLGIQDKPFEFAQFVKHGEGISLFNDDNGATGPSTTARGGCYAKSTNPTRDYDASKLQISSAYFSGGMLAADFGAATQDWSADWPIDFCVHGSEWHGINKDHELRPGHLKAYDAAMQATRALALHFLDKSGATSSTSISRACSSNVDALLKCFGTGTGSLDAYKVSSIKALTPNVAAEDFKPSFKFTINKVIANQGLLHVTFDGEACYIYDDDNNSTTKTFFCDSDKKGAGTLRIAQKALSALPLYESNTFAIRCENGLSSVDGGCGNIVSDTIAPFFVEIGKAISFWLNSTLQSIKTVVWNFGEAVGEKTVAFSSLLGVSDTVSATFTSAGIKTITATFKDALDNVLGTATTTVTATAAPIPTAIIATATSVSGTQPGTIANGASTTDAAPKLNGTISAALSVGQLVRVYDGTILLGAASLTGTSWTFTPSTPLLNGSHVFTAVVYDAGRMLEGAASNSWDVTVATAATIAGKLPHSGITANQCYQANSDTLVACSSAGALALNGQQDGHRADINAMSYSLVPNASGGNYSKEECVKDNVTGLIWEGKTQTGSRAGGEFVVFPGSGGVGFGTYVNNVNAAMLCGFNDWRIPSVDELQNIVDYGAENSGVAIDANWFPNSAGGVYMTSTLHAVSGPEQWFITFSTGYVFSAWRSDISYAHVRLVRP